MLKTKALVVGAIVCALAAGGVAYATIPGPDGVIHGCYTKSGGALRVIDGGVTKCKSTETSLDWSQHGLPGPTGAVGATGPAGPAGTARAWALVGSDGTISQGVNVSTVAHYGTGIYCVGLNGIDASSVAAVASASAGSAEHLVAEASRGCSVGGAAGIQVHIWDTLYGLDENGEFSIAVP